jgi:hypothetical protein
LQVGLDPQVLELPPVRVEDAHRRFTGSPRPSCVKARPIRPSTAIKRTRPNSATCTSCARGVAVVEAGRRALPLLAVVVGVAPHVHTRVGRLQLDMSAQQTADGDRKVGAGRAGPACGQGLRAVRRRLFGTCTGLPGGGVKLDRAYKAQGVCVVGGVRDSGACLMSNLASVRKRNADSFRYGFWRRLACPAK